MAARVLAITAVALPILGIAYILARVGAVQLGAAVWREDRASPLDRSPPSPLPPPFAVAWGAGGGPVTGRLPVQPYERGTLFHAVHRSCGSSPSGADRGPREAVRGWVKRRPTHRGESELAIVLVPREPATSRPASPSWSGSRAAAWVFPFDKPLAPGRATTRHWPSTPRTEPLITTWRSHGGAEDEPWR